MRTLLLVACVYALMSLVTFAAFARDKRAAKRGRRRTPERTLHALELACGWPGALLALRLLRHKSAKRPYRVVLLIIISLHLLLWGALAWVWIN
ncbi:MAG: DUF1294 domain-containing protein [Phycisphaerales bacterium JB059]